MSGTTAISIADMSPKNVWQDLQESINTGLVDCRTQQEWSVIGTPDLGAIDKSLHLIEWRRQPDMSYNPEFAKELDEALEGNYPDRLYFICRSGARSYEAATFVQNLLSSKNIECTCINVAEGFEGDPGPDGRRGTHNGWKANNLPWQQG